MDEIASSPDSASWATKRGFPRFRLETQVIVTELGSGVTRAVKGWSRDVCEGGLGGIVADGFNPDDEVLVEFPLPSGPATTAAARPRTPPLEFTLWLRIPADQSSGAPR